MRKLFTRFLFWLYKPFLTAVLDDYDLRLREYLKLKFEHTESELDGHDVRILSAVAQGWAEVRMEIHKIRHDFVGLKNDLTAQELQNRADLANWLTPKFQLLAAQVATTGSTNLPENGHVEQPTPREPKEFTYDERQ